MGEGEGEGNSGINTRDSGALVISNKSNDWYWMCKRTKQPPPIAYFLVNFPEEV